MIALAASHSHGRAIIIPRSILIGTVRANGCSLGPEALNEAGIVRSRSFPGRTFLREQALAGSHELPQQPCSHRPAPGCLAAYRAAWPPQALHGYVGKSGAAPPGRLQP